MANTRLKGKRIVLTKSVHDRDDIKTALENAGAEVLHLPLIEVHGVEDSQRCVEVLKGIVTYDWIVFTSVNGVRYFFKTFFKAFKDIRCVGPARIACVGKRTTAEVNALHLEVDLVPEKHNGVALAESLVESGSLPSAYVLWVSGDKVNKDAIGLLEGKGEAILDVFTVYKSKLRSLESDPVAVDFRKKGADAILFASPSGVESFVQQVSQLKRAKGATSPKTLSIGPSTSEAMKKLKVPLDRECKSPDADQVVVAFAKLLNSK